MKIQETVTAPFRPYQETSAERNTASVAPDASLTVRAGAGLAPVSVGKMPGLDGGAGGDLGALAVAQDDDNHGGPPSG